MIKLKELINERTGMISEKEAGKILDELVKLFRTNKHGDSLKYLFTDKSYRRFAIRTIRMATL